MAIPGSLALACGGIPQVYHEQILQYLQKPDNNFQCLRHHPRIYPKAGLGREMIGFSSYPRILSNVRQHSSLETFRYEVSK